MRNGAAFLFLVLLDAGCSSRSGHEPTATGTKSAACLTPRHQVTTLYSGNVSGFVAVGDALVVQGDGLVRVAMSTGQTTNIAMVQDPYDLVALDGTLYFTAEQLAGTPDAQGKQSSESVFQSVSADGGTPQTIPSMTPGTLAHAVDDDSLYFDVVSANAEVLKLTPPSTTPVELDLDGSILINAIAVHDGEVYIAGDDLTSLSSGQNGVIERISKNGGPSKRLVWGIGHPFNLIASDDGLFWVEDSEDFGPSHIVHCDFDGSSRGNLLETTASSLAIANGRLYFTAGDVESIPIAGGKPTIVASGLKSPGMLQVTGGNLVWVDPAERALSDPTVPGVMTTCIGE
ncbi:MAG TPA: hypothetical protein VH062_12770 [Polyangiaceae bacterium]|jgi:hypothetical protein|nr:hypothetical protein [Polyangiaceae bacterium]